jgi:hypothetical protein
MNSLPNHPKVVPSYRSHFDPVIKIYWIGLRDDAKFAKAYSTILARMSASGTKHASNFPKIR